MRRIMLLLAMVAVMLVGTAASALAAGPVTVDPGRRVFLDGELCQNLKEVGAIDNSAGLDTNADDVRCVVRVDQAPFGP